MTKLINNLQKKPLIINPPKFLEMPNFSEVWEYRHLLLFLTRRDIKIRFQQTFIGFLWIVLQPLIQMVIFTVILGIFIKVPTGEIPYSIFFLSGFVVWQYFNQVVNTSAYSLVSNIGIISKIYFPNLVLPLSSILSSLVDFFISLLVLLIFLLANNFLITPRYFLIPILLLLLTIFSSGVGLLFGALMVSFRDTKNLLGFIMMIWMYVTPLIFPLNVVPEQYLPLFFINPLTSIVESFRWIFLNQGSYPSIENILISFLGATIILFIGVFFFRSMENRITDVL